MKISPLPKPSAAELELLQILWRLEPATVKMVHEDAMRGVEAPKALTTTLKIMQVMEEKGLIRREGVSRPQRFVAVLHKEEAQSGFMRDVLKRVFQGDAQQMVLCALQESDINEKNLREIRALIESRRKGNK